MPETDAAPIRSSGRPTVAERRDCVVGVRLTEAEFEGLSLMLSNPRASMSDLCRELLSEAVLERLRRAHTSDFVKDLQTNAEATKALLAASDVSAEVAASVKARLAGR